MYQKDSDSLNEYFVHVSGLKDQIKENDEVTFELQEGKKGINAVDVRLA
jgi:CspA family cold shock protein